MCIVAFSGCRSCSKCLLGCDFNPHKTLRCQNCFSPIYRGDNWIKGGLGSCQGYTSKKWRSLNSNPESVAPEPKHVTIQSHWLAPRLMHALSHFQQHNGQAHDVTKALEVERLLFPSQFQPLTEWGTSSQFSLPVQTGDGDSTS